MYPPQRARVRRASPRPDSSPYYDSSRAHMHEDVSAHGYRCVASMCTRNAVPVGNGGGGGMEWAGRGGRRVGARGALAALTAALLAGGLQLTTPGSMGRAEIPHVRGAERAAFRLSLAGGEPFPVYGLVHRSPHPLAISLFTVRVERVRYVHVQVSLRRSVLSALYTVYVADRLRPG
jgi:hypothetical protein